MFAMIYKFFIVLFICTSFGRFVNLLFLSSTCEPKKKKIREKKRRNC